MGGYNNHGLYLENNTNTNTHIQTLVQTKSNRKHNVASNSMVSYLEILVMISFVHRSMKPNQMAEKFAILFGVVVSKFDLKDHAWRWCN